ACGMLFMGYKLEYGPGSDPTGWLPISNSNVLADLSVPLDIDDSGDHTIQGNLATWDTGLKNYVYLPSHPRDHPINLKGTYTIRLVVTGKDGKEVEDRTTVTVADVIPNALGGQATSKDGRVVLTVPAQAIKDAFRLISFENTQ